MSDFTELYRDIIQFHNDHPVHYEKKEDCTNSIEAYNPFCGDHYHLCVEVKDGKFLNPSFYGFGCALSKASTSILIKYISEHGVDDFLRLYEDYKKMLEPDYDISNIELELEELQAFEGVRRNPGRHTCAILSWKSLADQLQE